MISYLVEAWMKYYMVSSALAVNLNLVSFSVILLHMFVMIINSFFQYNLALKTQQNFIEQATPLLLVLSTQFLFSFFNYCLCLQLEMVCEFKLINTSHITHTEILSEQYVQFFTGAVCLTIKERKLNVQYMGIIHMIGTPVHQYHVNHLKAQRNTIKIFLSDTRWYKSVYPYILGLPV